MKFFKQPKNILLCTMIMLGILLLVVPAHALVMETVASIVGNIVAGIVWIIGRVLVGLMFILIWIATYNDFINSTAVNSGWVILRDVCNMFFIVILLFVAFATVLNIEGYSWKKILPKMLIMAVLINFSKLICGVIIDIAQVVMLTFVNGFRDVGGGNLTDMLGINKLLSIGNNEASYTAEGITPLSVMGTYILALGYLIVSTIVILVIVCVLVMRIVMLWILVTLSPLAYFLAALPNTKKHAENWWKQFIDNVISGPILAFFIWLAFTSASTDAGNFKAKTPMPIPGTNEGKVINETQPYAGLSSAGSAEGMLKFIISIGMLVGGLMITKELSGMAGKIAGAGLNAIGKTGKTLSGFNAVNDRVKAFNKQREAARSEKVSNFGAGMYGKYSSVKGGIAGSVQSLKARAGEIPIIGSFTTPIQDIKKMGTAMRNKIQGTPEQREEKRQQRDRLLNAYENGSYTDKNDNKFSQHSHSFKGKTIYTNPLLDKNGEVYENVVATATPRAQLDKFGKEIKGNDGKTIYKDALLEYREKKDSEGNIIKDKNGKVEREEVVVYRDKLVDKDGNIYKDPNTDRVRYVEGKGEELTDQNEIIYKLDKVNYETGKAWTKSMVESRAYNNQREEKKVSTEQEKLSKAGLTPSQLLGVLKDSSANDHKRMAAALELAVKQGFKSRDQVGIMRDKLNGHNNTLLSKKFNDEVDKKQAYLNYDIDTEEGRKKLMKRDQAGKVEVQMPDAYRNKNFIRAYSESLTDDEFKAKMKRAEAYSSNHSDSFKEGYRGYLDEQIPIFNKDKELDKSRKMVKDLTKDLNDVGRGEGVTKDNMKDVLKAAFDNMTSADIGKLDAKSFEGIKATLGSDEKVAAYNLAMSQILNNLQNPDKIINNQNANQKTIKVLREKFINNPNLNQKQAKVATDDEDEEELI